MSHEPKTRALEAYAAGRLTAAGGERVERHLRRCAACRAQLGVIRAYGSLREDVRALAVPQLDWQRLAGALPSTATDTARTARVAHPTSPLGRLGPSRRRWIYPTIAVAAAVAVAVLSSTGAPPATSGPPAAPAAAAVAVGEGSPPKGPAAATPEPRLPGVATALAGTVTLSSGGQGSIPLQMTTAILEGAQLTTGHDGVLDLQVGGDVALRLAPNTSVALRRLRPHHIAIHLRTGKVTQSVAKRVGKARYSVIFDGYRAEVLGTRFAVTSEPNRASVNVAEGAVRISRVEAQVGGADVTTVSAGKAWSTTHTPSAETHSRDTTAGTQPVPVLRTVPAPLDMPSLVLPAMPQAKLWQVGMAEMGTSLPLAIRLPSGPSTLGALTKGGRLIEVEVDPAVDDGPGLVAKLRRKLEPTAKPGHLPAKVIVSSLRPAQRGYQRCFEAALKHDAELRPDLKLRVTLAPDGRVSRQRLLGDAGPRALQQCLRQITRQTRFPAPGGPLTFEVPLKFRARR